MIISVDNLRPYNPNWSVKITPVVGADHTTTIRDKVLRGIDSWACYGVLLVVTVKLLQLRLLHPCGIILLHVCTTNNDVAESDNDFLPCQSRADDANDQDCGSDEPAIVDD